MARRCPSARPLFRAQLRDHRLDFTYFSSHWAGGAADVVPCFGESVWGGIYELSQDDLPLLDRFEGGYERVLLSVVDDTGTQHPVLSYRVLAKRSFRPTDVYLRKILHWGETWKLPSDYLSRLRTNWSSERPCS